MTIDITLDNLDTAIKKLEDLSKKLERFGKDVAYESMENVRYDGSNPVLIEIGDQLIIENVGDQVVFQEFGAGFPAQETTIEIDGASYASYPGVYSNDHADTYYKHLMKMAYGNATEEDYRYNREPGMKMQKEVERLRNYTDQKAKDYFG